MYRLLLKHCQKFIAIILKTFLDLSCSVVPCNLVRSRLFSVEIECRQWPPSFLSRRSINDSPCIRRRCSRYCRLWFECHAPFCFMVHVWLQRAHGTQDLSDISIKGVHTESNPRNVGVRESSLLYLPNCLQALGPSNDV